MLRRFPHATCDRCLTGVALAAYTTDDPESPKDLCGACIFETPQRLQLLIEDLTGGWWTTHYEEESDVRHR